MKISFFIVCLFTITFSLAQKKDTVVLDKGIWISGVEGGLSNARALNSGSAGDIEKSIDYVFSLSSGLFLGKKVAVGLNFILSKREETRTSLTSTNEEFYFGPWVRYYIPMQHNWYVYPELGVSYVNYFSELYNDNSDNSVLHAQGLGVNPGIGIVYFVTSKNTLFG